MRKFRRLRTALQQLFGPLVDGGEPPATSSAAVKRVNALSSQTRVFPWLEVRHGTYDKRTADGSQDASLAAVARASIELLAGSGRGAPRALPGAELRAVLPEGRPSPRMVLGGLRQPRPRRAPLLAPPLPRQRNATGMRLGPRLVVAGAHSGVGKTTVATGLMAALRSGGRRVAPAKVGPDFIDPGYHALACDRPGRNLDAWLCGAELVGPLAARASADADMLVVEGVMGLFDGAGDGTPSSTADIARLLQAPVLLVVDCSAQAGSVAALVHGFATFDPRLEARRRGTQSTRLGRPRTPGA